MKVIPIGNRLGVTCEEMIQSSAQKVTVADSYIPAAQPTGEIFVQTSFDMNPVYEYVYDPKYFAPYNGIVRDHIGYLHPKLEELIPETMDEYDAVIKTFREMPIPITYGNKNYLGVEYPTHRVTSGTCYACSLSGFIPQVVDASGNVIPNLKKSKFDPSSMRYELKKDLTQSIGRVGCVDASQDYIGPQADVMIIGQYPTMNAIRAGKPFESDHKFYIDNFLLPAAGIERSKVVYSYACHCRQGAKDNVKPKKENVEACYMNRLRAEILHYQPKLIIAMGPEPQIVFKGFAKVDTYRGTGEEWVEESTGFKTIVCYTHSVNIIDADNAPKQNKSQSGDTDTKRDARDLMMSDFAWIGDVYRDPSWLHPMKKVAIQTDYKVLMPDDHIDKYVEAFESLRAMIYAKPDRLVAVDIETTAVTNDITCMSFTPVPGKAFVFPMLSRVFPNDEKTKFAEASLKKDASGAVISDSRYIKNGALSKRGEKYAAMPDFIGEDYFVKDDTKRKYIYDMIKYLLEEPTIHKVAHNGRFDARIIYMNGIDMRSFRHDTLIAHCLINEESVRGLKDLTDMYIRRLRGYSVAMEEAKDRYVTDGNWLRIPYCITAPYNAIDTDATLSLFYYIKGRVLQTDPNDWAFYEYYGMKLQDVMLRMEHVGALVDDKYIKEQNEKTYVQLKEVAKRIIDFVKERSTKFNTLSYDNINEEGSMDKATTQCPKGFKADGNTDVTDVLIECGVELTARTDTGWARGEDVLAVFKKHEVAGKFITDVLEHRSLSTRLAFYKDYMDKRDAAGRVHSSFAVWGAATGRFTCIAEGMRVKTLRGEIPIEKVEVGDRVLTHTGSWKFVKNVMYNGFRKVGLLTGKNVRDIMCTSDHRFYTKKGWVVAEKLKEVYYVGKQSSTEGQNTCRESCDRIHIRKKAHSGGLGEGAIYNTSDSKKNFAVKLRTGSIQGRKGIKVFQREVTSSESYVRENNNTASQLERGLFGQQGSLHADSGREKVLCSQNSYGGSTRTSSRKLTRRPAGSSYRWRSIKQHTEQPSFSYIGRTQKFAQKVEKVTFTRNVGEVRVYDLEVEDDHSFVCEGYLVHNCSRPNLQQLPRDKAIKMLIVAPEGYSIVQGDLSQAELRILAYYSGEERMQAVFRGFTARCDNVQGMILNMSEKTLGDTAFFYLIENKRNKNWYCFKPVAGTETSIELIGKVVKDDKLPGAKKIVTETPKGQYIVPITPEQLQEEFCHGDFLSTGSGDIHCFTASQINDCLLSEVVKSQRSAAKSVSFGIPYGISAHGLAAQLETTKEEAQKLMDLFFTKFPKVRDYLNGVVKTAGEYASRHGIGMVTTEFGRKRRLSDFTSWMKERRGHAERQAVNFGIQSTCHDLMARHIITIDEEIGQTGLDAKMFNQVHDSVLFYVKTDEAQAFAKWLKQIMERPYLNTDMPFTADVEIYRRAWSGELIDIEEEAMAA
jgi:uracil-DNA glycosylase family 4